MSNVEPFLKVVFTFVDETRQRKLDVIDGLESHLAGRDLLLGQDGARQNARPRLEERAFVVCEALGHCHQYKDERAKER